MNFCTECGLQGGCACLYEKTGHLCKKCSAAQRKEELPLDLKMEFELNQQPMQPTREKSFIRDVYDTEIGPRMGERRATFRAMLLHLENLNLNSYTILETGCVRDANDWSGAGCSTLIFDRFVSYYDGKVTSVDLTPQNCALAQQLTSDKTEVICSDSLTFLKENEARGADLIYLDSWDYEPSQDGQFPLENPAALHGWEEFLAALPHLKDGGILAVDDNFDGATRGKGSRIAAWLNERNIAPLVAGRQLAWVLTDCPTPAKRKQIDLYSHAQGIGDAVCAVYTACGLANKGYFVTLYAKHKGWIDRISHPNLRILPESEKPASAIDVNHNYGGQLVSATTRKQWYCDNVSRFAAIEKFKPVKPRKIGSYGKPILGEKYVVLSPFSQYPSRHWPLNHWSVLANLLSEAGFKVIAIDGPGDGKRLADVFGNTSATWYWGNSAEWTANILQNAQCVVGNDSGMVHVAGLLKTPTIAVHAHLSPEFLFEATAISSLTPHQTTEVPCTFCRWQHSNGYRSTCDSGCFALATVTPYTVKDRVLELTGTRSLKENIAN